jgi:uncharacterized protein YndB with AHSA1/START domain
MIRSTQTHAIGLEPVRKEVTIPVGVEVAFRLFTRDMGRWWPLDRLAIHPDRVTELVFEERQGGRILERWTDGEAPWGRITTWQPPSRLIIAWAPTLTPGAIPTEVEVRFEPDGPDRTIVRLEHRGWERLGNRGAAASAEYRNGWPGVLARYVAAAAEDRASSRSPGA